MKRFKVFYVLIFVVLSSCSLYARANWTVLMYAQSRNNLDLYMKRCVKNLSAIGSNEKLNLLIQWYKPGNKAVRYKIEKKKLVPDNDGFENSTGSKAEDLSGAMAWAARKYPAKKYGLILRDHGLGVLDPDPGKWHHSLGRSVNLNYELCFDSPQVLARSVDNTSICFHENDQSSMYRGILYNSHQHTYMDYDNLSAGLRDISQNILSGKKLDFLGMDACLMAMFEVAYQVRNYAKYFIASEDAEWASGWNYFYFLRPLLQNDQAPVTVAKNIVAGFSSWHHKTPKFNTQSATDCAQVNRLKNNIDTFVACVQVCQKYDKANINKLIKTARRATIQFYERCYADLHNFYTEVNKRLAVYAQKNKKKNPEFLTAIQNMQDILIDGIKIIEKDVIVANSSHRESARAKGLSIYFPQEKIHFSYKKNEFAQESLWLDFLKSLRA